MTTAGFMSGTRDVAPPSRISRLAAAAALLLGGSLVLVLPDLAAAAFYLAVLGGSTAVVALACGVLLWSRVTLVARAVAVLAAVATLLGQVLESLLGFPGARDLAELSAAETLAPPVLAGSVLLLLTLDGSRRRPEPAPDRPYAL